MKNSTKLFLAAAAIPLFAVSLMAQQVNQVADSGTKTDSGTDSGPRDTTAPMAG